MTTELENDARSALAHFGEGAQDIDTHAHTHSHTLTNVST